MNALAIAENFNPLDGLPERPLPHDFEIEQQLIGAVLMKPKLIEAVADIVRADHFASAAHIAIWEIIAEDFNAGRTATPPMINKRLAEDQEYLDLGGAQYLVGLCASVAIALPNVVAQYAQTVADLWLRRKAITELQEAVETLYRDPEAPASAQIERLETGLAAITGDVAGENTISTFAEAVDVSLAQMQAAVNADGKLIGITTGLRDLDAKLGGLHDSDLIILAGRPSMGKTALGQSIAEAAARDGKPVAFFSLEMAAEQLSTRAIASASQIPSFHIREGRLSVSEQVTVAQAGHDIKSLPIIIDDDGSLTVGGLRTRARRIKRKHGLALIVVDYLQLLRAPGAYNSRDGNRTQEVSEITRALKALAKELRVPVLALSQLSRKVEDRDDKRPQLADLRESGSIEQDADVVMFVYREEYYLERSEPSDQTSKKWDEWSAKMNQSRAIAEIIIGKQRHGPTGTVKTWFNGNLTKFGDLETHHGG